MRTLTLLLLALTALSLVACGGASATQPPSGGGAGDPAAGQAVFNQQAAPPCSSCHSVNPGETKIGPSLAGISAKGEAFIRGIINDPTTANLPGFSPNVMPKNYATALSAQQVNDLVAYLMTLK